MSTEAQNIARQMEEMYKLGLTDEFIYVDKQSGKDFERENYKLLKEILKKAMAIRKKLILNQKLLMKMKLGL